ncbi:MAG: cell division FtsZ family protein [Deltaproteobacteria bacterium]|jgi:cell division protein FtsZ|nr:cell division FtsZ family protein [Deltaproteobacteria bacterium]
MDDNFLNSDSSVPSGSDMKKAETGDLINHSDPSRQVSMDDDFLDPESLVPSGSEMEFVIEEPVLDEHRIQVMGLGGCGSNAVNHMIRCGVKGPYFIGANSDLQALEPCLAETKIQLGVRTSAGHGCGGDPEVGRRCAEENLVQVLQALKGSDMVFLMAGLGGGTGTGAIPVVARALSLLDEPPLVVGVVTRPFPWEDWRDQVSGPVIRELREFCNSVIVIPNSALVDLVPDLPFLEAKGMVDDILLRAVGSIYNLTRTVGDMGVSFEDVAAIMSRKGSAIMGYGEASGPKRVQQALEKAISNPLMTRASLKGAKGVLVNITADKDFKNSEYKAVSQLVRDEVGQGVEYILGVVVDNSLAEAGIMQVTVVATGLELEEDAAEDAAACPELVELTPEDEFFEDEEYPAERIVAVRPGPSPAGSGPLAPPAAVNIRRTAPSRDPAPPAAPVRPQTFQPAETRVRNPPEVNIRRTPQPAQFGMDLGRLYGEFYDIPPAMRNKSAK